MTCFKGNPGSLLSGFPGMTPKPAVLGVFLRPLRFGSSERDSRPLQRVKNPLKKGQKRVKNLEKGSKKGCLYIIVGCTRVHFLAAFGRLLILTE